MLIKMTTYTAAAVLLASAAVSAQNSSTTLVGCVYEEKNVPGRAPNIAERAGFMEDYILAELSPADAAKPADSASRPVTYSMYKLERAADSQLKALVGKRVEVTGRIDAEAKDSTGQPSAGLETNKTDRVIGRDRIDLPEFEVASIKEVSGQCPARPSSTN